MFYTVCQSFAHFLTSGLSCGDFKLSICVCRGVVCFKGCKQLHGSIWFTVRYGYISCANKIRLLGRIGAYTPYGTKCFISW